MLYQILLFPARVFIHFYCRKIIINNKNYLSLKGPLLIAANHPNSFLDAIILATLFKHPIHSLARGDAFASKFITRILNSFNMLPVYRVSEGVENLENNYDTFSACQALFQKNGIILIFSEGRCINEWHLRPLKKGTARLALDAWSRGVPLKVLPLGINYNSFRKFGKIIHLNFGAVISNKDFSDDIFTGKKIVDFNHKLRDELDNLVYEIPPGDTNTYQQHFAVKNSLLKQVLLLLPAVAGVIIHTPLFLCIHLSIKNKAEDHYDSIMTGLLFFIYPLYIILIAVLSGIIFKSWSALCLILAIPFTLWSYVQMNSR